MRMFPIYHVSFPSQYLITSTLLRFQEHYESPEFRGKVFDLEAYVDWYVAQKGSFSYYTDWNGFNFPSRVLTPFCDGRFDPLSRKERAFLDLMSDVHGDFYVIGTHDQSPDHTFLAHETVHGLFYAEQDYADDVRNVLSGFPLTDFRQAIRDRGYHPDVIEDECNAYLTTGLSSFLDGKDANEASVARKALLKVCKDHFGVDPSTPNDRKWLIERINQRTFVLPSH